MSPPSESLLTRDEFLAAESLAALCGLYRERGVAGEEEQILERAQQDWHRVTLAAARAVEEAPPALPSVDVEREGVTYRVYGVMHGLIGGASRDYKDFVDAALSQLSGPLFENQFGYFYPGHGAVWIPDYAVFGLAGSARMGLEVGLGFLGILKDLFSELFKTKGGGVENELLEYDPRYHALDGETRRGLEPYPPLPSRLQIEYEMREWDRRGALAGWFCPGAIVPRSLFMAGFAEGYARSRGLSEVAIVVGDLHTMEIVRFLEAPPQAPPHPVFAAAQAFGRRSDGARKLAMIRGKVAHLGVAGLIGASILMTVIGVLVWAYQRLSAG